MKKILSIILCILSLITGCNQKEEIKTIDEVNIKDLQRYKGILVGNNSGVSSIINSLPGGSTYKEFELSDRSIKVIYGLKEDKSTLTKEELHTYWLNEHNIEKNFLYNATAIFILVQNAEKVTLELESEQDYSFSISREELNKIVPHSLSDYAQNINLWKEEILDILIKQDSNRKEFFSKYPKGLVIG
ncbi:DUF4825 domain-containing protein [Bacillus mycoides]|uniref:DUF4825 domain-containing protein n=1 Tax=Bacillus mycoides TaxID=1405 RepID=UPI003CFC6659